METHTLFRQLRKDRGLSLQQIADEVNSVSFISKFEKGDSQISFYRLERLLENINVTMEEFLYLRETSKFALKEYQWFSHHQVFISGPIFYTLEQMLAINNLTMAPGGITYEEAIQRYQNIKADLSDDIRWQRFFGLYCDLLIQASESNIRGQLANPEYSFEEMKRGWELTSRPVASYLFSVDNWGLFEIVLFRFFMFSFSTETAKNLLPIALKRTEKELGLALMRDMRFSLLGALFSSFMNQRLLVDGKEVLDKMAEITYNSRDLLSANLYLFYQGWYLLIAEDKDQGIEKCQQAIAVFRILRQPEYEDSHKRMLELLIKNRDEPHKYMIFT